MEYRALTVSDLDRWRDLEVYAFATSPGSDAPSAEKLGRMRGLFVDGGAQAAQLELIPLRLETGRGQIAAAGIGGVASAPESRQRGHVAALLRHSCDELREQGVPLAVLYPFKRAFYGRYGWATFMERRVYTGSPERFASFRPAPGGFQAAGPDQAADFDVIYRGALRGRFGPTVRNADWWRESVLADGDGKPYRAYIWRDEGGNPRSYMIYRVKDAVGGRRMECQDIVALDPTARAQLFAFFAGHADQVAHVQFKAPADAPVNLLMPEPLSCTVEPHFMLRLVDVAAALAGYGFPRDLKGRLRVGVGDDWITEHNAVFELELAAGRAEVRRLPSDSPADVSCDVRVLAQIYSRYLRPRTAAAFGMLAAASREALDLAERAFAGPAPFNADFF
ncbi:GNAT family N-acetyltransferase [Oscillochloris sp. ZM17-4]|uniref:GNAT family N-acetyltransferase n=1 Tax=Oscillochloris sp. ZM17-4 TaxID=2866714 RepID=UPI001C72B331|nr:GNAT family N-acetyltransferase [Oscillochloris sp. ZM17-4]MBX0327315.1 GNAT family N-acetyltransferase [Oscillochloris sp. ZM17-4]